MKFLKLLSALLLLFTIFSCSPTSENSVAPEDDPGKILIGHNPWSGNIPFYVEVAKGIFAQEGLDVEFQEAKSLGELTRNYVEGAFHGRTNLVLDAVQETMDGLDHRILFAIDYSNGADAILSDSSIKEPKDLMGKKVGYEKGTLTEFFLHHVLMQAGHNLSDVEHVEAGAEEAAIQLVEGKINAAVTYEPYLSNALN